MIKYYIQEGDDLYGFMMAHAPHVDHFIVTPTGSFSDLGKADAPYTGIIVECISPKEALAGVRKEG